MECGRQVDFGITERMTWATTSGVAERAWESQCEAFQAFWALGDRCVLCDLGYNTLGRVVAGRDGCFGRCAPESNGDSGLQQG